LLIAKINKILLIASPSIEYNLKGVSLKEKSIVRVVLPLGLVYIGAVLRENLYNVEIYEPHMESYEEGKEYTNEELVKIIKNMIIEKIDNNNYDFIGISSPYIYTYQWAHYIAEVVKDKQSEIPVAVGGGYPSMLADDVMKDGNIDYLIIGEGEISIIQLLGYLNSGDSRDISKIGGIAHRINNKVNINPTITYIDELDNLPFPAWDLIDYEKHMKYKLKRKLHIVSSRGCPYRCTFCGSHKYWGKMFRKRSAENVLGEIDYLRERFNTEEVDFVDDNMTVDKEWFMDVARGLNDRDISWQINHISSFTTDLEMLQAMKEGGCTAVSIAIESAVPETLKKLKKPVNLERALELVQHCKKIGIECYLLFITGLPYDTKEDMLTSFKFAENANADWITFNMLVPYPSTAIFKYCKDRNYFIDEDLDLSKFTQRNQGFINTENWDREWVATMTYDYNIKINFIKNFNILDDNGNLNSAITNIGHVVRFHSGHVIAYLSLAYAYKKKGKLDKTEELLKQADLLLDEKDVQETYGKYMLWDEEAINFYHSWKMQ